VAREWQEHQMIITKENPNHSARREREHARLALLMKVLLHERPSKEISVGFLKFSLPSLIIGS